MNNNLEELGNNKNIHNKPYIIKSNQYIQSYYDYLFKISLIGDSGSGKTSILLRLTENVFYSNTSSTIGVDFKILTTKYRSKQAKVQIWDTCGSERFKSLTTSFVKTCNVFILVFDLSNKKSFDSLNYWINLILENTKPKLIVLVGNKCDLFKSFYENDNINKYANIIINDQNDLNKDNTININVNSIGGHVNTNYNNDLIIKEVINKEDILKFIERYDVYYLETSAKLNNNIEKMFEIICEKLFDDALNKNNNNNNADKSNYSNYKNLDTIGNNSNIKLTYKNKHKIKKCCK